MVSKLNGDIILICGPNEKRYIRDLYRNNFELFRHELLDLGFYGVYEYPIEVAEMWLCHDYNDINKDKFNLYGGSLLDDEFSPYGLNVGLKLHNHKYDPTSYTQILTIKNIIYKLRQKED